FMRDFDDGLSSVRYPRDNVSQRFVGQACPPFELGKARLLTAPQTDLDVAVLAFGTLAVTALEAADLLASEYRIAVYDARSAKPVDAALIRDLLSPGTPILTVEDHSVVGGFGSAVVDAAQEAGLDASRIVRLGLPDSWVYQDSRPGQLAEVGLDAAGIA